METQVEVNVEAESVDLVARLRDAADAAKLAVEDRYWALVRTLATTGGLSAAQERELGKLIEELPGGQARLAEHVQALKRVEELGAWQTLSPAVRALEQAASAALAGWVAEIAELEQRVRDIRSLMAALRPRLSALQNIRLGALAELRRTVAKHPRLLRAADWLEREAAFDTVPLARWEEALTSPLHAAELKQRAAPPAEAPQPGAVAAGVGAAPEST